MTPRVGIAHASPRRYTHPNAVIRSAIAGVRDVSQRTRSTTAPTTTTTGSASVNSTNIRYTIGIVINRRDQACCITVNADAISSYCSMSRHRPSRCLPGITIVPD